MIKLKVDGMTCNHCVMAVSKALAGVPGVTKVLDVNRDEGFAVVDGNADPAQLVEAVVQEGYKAQVSE